MNDILSRITQADARIFLEYASAYAPIDIDYGSAIIQALIREKRGATLQDGEAAPIRALEARWYDSLDSEPDYSVYADPYYFCDIWLCWVTYSRKYLREIQKSHSMFDRSIVSDIVDIRRVLDLGCGFGYTTAALRSIFGDAQVIGTNLSGTAQFEMATALGVTHGFQIRPLPESADLIFASEYFEHFQEPIEHLLDVLRDANPRYALIANTFTSPSIGHFPRYKHRGRWYEGAAMSRLFNATLRRHGYVKMHTRCWNSRPAYWKKASV